MVLCSRRAVPGHSWKFDIIDKILDYSLEDEDRCEHDGDIGGHAEMGNLLVPTEEIAGAMEAVEVTMAVDDDNNVTVAEPDEEELPEAIAEPEQEQSAEVDFDEGYDDDEEQERHPVLVIENIRHIERIAASAQVALQTPYFPSHRSAICVDPHQLAYTFMSFLRVVPMHSHALEGLQQICESTTASSGNMLTMAIVTIKLDPWAVLHVWNPVTGISAEVSDTEILNEPRNGQATKDPDGTLFLRRETFNPEMDKTQENTCSDVHY
ncbi:unnamed protein product, partial [Symbiodinium necroappetens]